MPRGISRKRRIASKALYTLASLSLFFSIWTFFYPTVAKLYNDMTARSVITRYEKNVNDQSEAETLKAADEYNDMLFHMGNQKMLKRNSLDAASLATGADENGDARYEAMLAGENGVMGSVNIPKIGVIQPIRHYTTDEVLAKGAGHFYGSSLPVGGKNTHTVITGHSGLATSRMFDDLTRLKEGDVFILSTFGRRSAYQIDEIKTVLPDNTEGLRIVSDKDIATLVTCTPYGVNTHRLLVTGHRIPVRKAAKQVKKAETKKKRTIVLMILLFGISIALFIISIIRIWKPLF